MGKLLAFGEVMLRLSPPGRELLMQSPRLDLWVGGAEVNVATALARLGQEVGIATMLPDNDLGRGVVAVMRGHGIDTSTVGYRGDRLGLYFVTNGAGVRATEVLYDRAGSAFAEAAPDAWDWERLLQGVDRLHLSGVTPALGPISAQTAVAAARAASSRGIAVSFDGNWRGKLWERWSGDPRAILREIVAEADLMFGNHRDIALLLGRTDFSGDGEHRRREAADAAFDAFPKLQLIASTARQVDTVDVNRLSARIDTRDRAVQTAEVVIAGIVDRVGSGDAFAAGVLHGLRSGHNIDRTAQTGLALAALKHSLPGDAALFRQADVDVYLAGGLDVRR